jgi:hypothetical protein
MSPRSLLLLGAAFLPGCADAGAAADADQVVAVFTAFQHALQQGDTSAAGRLLASDSQPVLAEMSWASVRARQALVPLSVERHDFEYWIHVRDPNEHGAESVFVVAREQGRLVVDLIATAGHNRTLKPKTGPTQFDDRPLTAEEQQQLRARAAAAMR